MTTEERLQLAQVVRCRPRERAAFCSSCRFERIVGFASVGKPSGEARCLRHRCLCPFLLQATESGSIDRLYKGLGRRRAFDPFLFL